MILIDNWVFILAAIIFFCIFVLCLLVCWVISYCYSMRVTTAEQEKENANFDSLFRERYHVEMDKLKREED